MKQSDSSLDDINQNFFRLQLLEQLEAIVSRNTEVKTFDARSWLNQWLECPLPALGNHRPCEFLDTVDGRDLILTLLSRMESGAYS